VRKGTGFPRFPEGTVFIQVKRKSPKYNYTFDKAILSRASKWFAKNMDSEMEEVDLDLAQKVKKFIGCDARYELYYSERNSGWALKKTVSA